MVPVYFVVFAVIFGLVLLYVKNHKTIVQEDPMKAMIYRRVLGGILLVISILAPHKTISMIFPDYFDGVFDMMGILFVIGAAAVIALGAFAVKMINKMYDGNTVSGIIGYLIIIALSAVPALVMINFDTSYESIGLAYYTAIIMAGVSWWGLSIIFKDEHSLN
eukprot:Anaeramoba_ignava/c18078_g1_i1.p7 GENE.c18078_g1_i1~~c18078_g1_i1.p7  ORF type:complete len:163 (+),score=7.51 c18078_g1_i1:5732-6220(+)